MRSNVFSVWDDLFVDFERAWNTLNRYTDPVTKTWSASTLVDSSFPPCNILLNKEKNLLLEYAVAGYQEDEIKLEYDRDQLVVSLLPNDSVEKSSDYKVLQHGIKRSRATSKVYVPTSIYDQGSIAAKLENGVLSIKINSLPETKPKKIEIASPKKAAIEDISP